MSLTLHTNGDSESFGMIGLDPKLRQIIETIRTAAPSDASVLIEGETGTGKQLIANAIHAESRRCAGPFVHANCAAIPHERSEAELFGNQQGACNCADRDRRGLIEAANGGTLMLDEIADMPAHLQTRFFRVLQEHKLRRPGDELEVGVNFRLIVTTSRNATTLLEKGVLKKDLYLRSTFSFVSTRSTTEKFAASRRKHCSAYCVTIGLEIFVSWKASLNGPFCFVRAIHYCLNLCPKNCKATTCTTFLS